MSLPTQAAITRSVKAAIKGAHELGYRVAAYEVTFNQGVPSVKVTTGAESPPPLPINTGENHVEIVTKRLARLHGRRDQGVWMTILSPAELASIRFRIEMGEFDPGVADEDDAEWAARVMIALLDHIAATDPRFANGPVECDCAGSIPQIGAGPPFFPETHTTNCALRQTRVPQPTDTPQAQAAQDSSREG